MELKILFVFNNNNWTSIPQKIKEIQDFYAPTVVIRSEVKFTNFTNIPFETIEAIHGIENITIKTKNITNEWYDKVVVPLATGHDIVVFCISEADKTGHVTSLGIQGDANEGVVECTIFGGEEFSNSYQFGENLGNSFVVFTTHEISHAIYLLLGKADNTHKYFYNGEPEKVLLDFVNTPVETKFYLTRLLMNYILQLTGLMKRQGLTNPDIPPAPVVFPVNKKYLWDNKVNVRHSCRVIMDEYGLRWGEKDLLCACIQQESQFNPRAIGKANSNGTVDYGLCQYNTGKNKTTGQAYWIGVGADFKDINEVLDSPEKNVRIMVREYKKGNLKLWSSYITGAYKKFMPR